MTALHTGPPPGPGEVWSTWAPDPLVVVPLAAAALFYAVGQRRMASRRGHTPATAYAFWAGWTTLVVALASPIDALGEALFSVHMVQHMLLVLVAAPLLVLGRTLEVFLRALPRRDRRRALALWERGGGRRAAAVLGWGPLAWVLHAVALWVWHAPPLYQAALESHLVHGVEHASFLATAALFWWVPVRDATRGRRGHGVGVFYVFTTALQAGALGALITFAEIAWYPAHEAGARAWGLSLVEDQQAAGLIMWLPGGLVYLAATGALLVGLLRSAERRARLRSDHLQERAPGPAVGAPEGAPTGSG